ncbi:MAG: acyltransferase [Chitinophagaceae bacterium]|nr:acyltransferase [Chitinophagaceae bacterium]
MAGTNYIKSLDGLRAIAILLVMTYHAELTHFGWIGVQFFFVLSGFLITGILWNEKFKPAPRSFKLKKFWVRRSLRIFPLYYGYILAIGICFLLFNFPSYYTTYFPYLVTYTVNYTRLLPGWQGNPLFTHLWSLSIEEQFYLLFPLIILFTPAKHIPKLLVVIMIVSPSVRFLLGEYYKARGYSANVVANVVNFNTLSHLDAFCTGGIIPILSLDKRIRKPGTVFLVAALIAITAGLVNYANSAHAGNYWEDLGWNHWQTGNYQHVWMYTMINILGASVILMLVSSHSQQLMKYPKRVLEHRWMVRIGQISYGMYLFHWLILVYVFNKILQPETYLSKALIFIPYVITVYLFSEVSYRLYEVHFIKLKDRFFTKPDVQEHSGIGSSSKSVAINDTTR